ncbi:NAD(P)/FAD-dependent oxidoreductase [soil metagenome]
MSKNKHRVVIAGGGYGGIKAALELCEDPRFHITLISDHPDFRVYASLYRTATGGPRSIASIPLTEIFENRAVNIVYDKIANLDRQTRTINTAGGREFSYEALLVCIGVQTNYFGIKGLAEYSYGIKTPADAEELKRHLHSQMTEEGHPDLNYAVVGGGPTGVELAGALPDYLHHVAELHGMPKRKIHVDLIEAAPRLLPNMPKDISSMVAMHLRKIGVKIYLRTCVQAQTADALMINNKPLRSHTVIWTAGVANNSFFEDQGFQLAKSGKVRVDQFLQAEKAVYVLGDNADTPYSGMAQTALYDGEYVAHNLMRLANSENPKPYVAKKPIYVMPAGPGWAAVLWGKIRIYGRLGWALRRLADLVAYSDYEPRQMALKRFLAESSSEESCLVCRNKEEALEYRSGIA